MDVVSHIEQIVEVEIQIVEIAQAVLEVELVHQAQAHLFTDTIHDAGMETESIEVVGYLVNDTNTTLPAFI